MIPPSSTTKVTGTASVREHTRFPESSYVHWVSVDPAHAVGPPDMSTVMERRRADGAPHRSSRPTTSGSSDHLVSWTGILSAKFDPITRSDGRYWRSPTRSEGQISMAKSEQMRVARRRAPWRRASRSANPTIASSSRGLRSRGGDERGIRREIRRQDLSAIRGVSQGLRLAGHGLAAAYHAPQAVRTARRCACAWRVPAAGVEQVNLLLGGAAMDAPPLHDEPRNCLWRLNLIIVGAMRGQRVR